MGEMRHLKLGGLLLLVGLTSGCATMTPQGEVFARGLVTQAEYSAVDEEVRGGVRKSQGHKDYPQGQERAINQNRMVNMSPKRYLDGSVLIPELTGVEVIVHYKNNRTRKGTIKRINNRSVWEENKSAVGGFIDGRIKYTLTTDNLSWFSINGQRLHILIRDAYGEEFFK